jgi:hypothetical protein
MATGRDVVGAAIIGSWAAVHRCSWPVGWNGLTARKWPRQSHGYEPTIQISHERLLTPENGPARFGGWSRLSSGRTEWCGSFEDGVTARRHAC